jgi:hypothetical protein
VGPEVKSVTLSVAGPVATIAAAGATVQNQNLSTGYCALNHVQQGDTNQTRDGFIVTGKSLGIRFNVVSGANAETSDAWIRWLIVIDNTPNSSNSPLSQILEDYDQAGANTTTINSGINPQNRNRMFIMASGQGVVSKISGPTPCVTVSRLINLDNMQTAYTGSANPMTYAYMKSNTIYFIIMAQMTGAGTLPTINNFVARYYFTEK